MVVLVVYDGGCDVGFLWLFLVVVYGGDDDGNNYNNKQYGQHEDISFHVFDYKFSFNSRWI